MAPDCLEKLLAVVRPLLQDPHPRNPLPLESYSMEQGHWWEEDLRGSPGYSSWLWFTLS